MVCVDNYKTSLLMSIIIVFVVSFTYFDSINFDFVYDDNRQIERNLLIQDSKQYKNAMLADVWAFKGNSNIVMSNYWRPTFVSWMIINHHFFKLEPKLWHITNIALHLLLCLLVFYYLSFWTKSNIIRVTIALLFAIHPIHVESVAWVSGSPDILFGVFVMLSFILLQYFFYTSRTKLIKIAFFVLSGLFYALALGAKEVGILLFPVYFLLIKWILEKNKPLNRRLNTNTQAFKLTLLFIFIALIYFISRYAILGFVSRPYTSDIPFTQLLFTAPKIIAFYIKQAVFPIELSTNYNLRLVSQFSFNNVLIPFFTVVITAYFLIKIAIKSKIQTLGLALLVLPLIPTINISAFHPEQIVHDRYLYLPILGFYMVIIPWFYQLFDKKQTLIFYLFITITVSLFVFQSKTYMSVWRSNSALWEHAVKVDSSSSFNWSQLANSQLEQRDYEKAIQSFKKSLSIKSSTRTQYGLARAFVTKKEYQKAYKILTKLLKNKINLDPYLYYQVIELYSILLVNTQNFIQAENILKESIQNYPFYKAALSEKLAVIYYMQNKKPKALLVLQNAEKEVKNETLFESKKVYFRLGQLYQELKQRQEATNAFAQFIYSTNGIQDNQIKQLRAIAHKAIKKIAKETL